LRVMSLREEIAGLVYQPLARKNIVLGVTGSSAVYKSVDLARRLIRMGATVRVVMTRFSTRLIGPDLFYWATGSKPYIEMTGETEHIDLAKWGDAMVVAPATLNTMSKIAYGVLDELLPLVAVTMIGSGKRVVVVPAMNIRLFNTPQYKRAVEILEEQGVSIIPPLVEEDKAKYPPLEDLAHCVDAIVNRGRDLAGHRVLVTAGPTREHIDPVRVITNPSSGLMGVLVAREAACRGAVVDLVHGPISVEAPYMVNKYSVETTEDMARAVESLTEKYEYSIAVFAAAPADYKPVASSTEKIPSRSTPRLVLELTSTPKVLKSISKRPRVLVGFAAETASGEKLLEKALEKISDYNFDLLVANNVLSERAGFAKLFLDALVVDKSGRVLEKGLLVKHEVARKLLDYAKEKLY
jgi:phosphopantothenoylcysteine decarboxylase/phosphopantothenate--cysteine ligase